MNKVRFKVIAGGYQAECFDGPSTSFKGNYLRVYRTLFQYGFRAIGLALIKDKFIQ